ncbi:MAG: histidinol phosphatase [Bacteroidetes bacterium]|nr:histidinol phosphatase [Bacteroidota bacterium]MBS1671059.1 histidinol phosphatase [Bacteroidota bacterium]
MFFFSKKNILTDLSFLGADMHNHLLPNLDDGLQTENETIQFIEKFKTLGYKKIICTPHILSGVHSNNTTTILPALNRIKTLVKEKNINVEIEAAAEYMIDHELEALIDKNQPLLTFGNNYILIEMSYMAASPYLEQVIFNLKMKGLQPVLAHPERYSYYHSNFNKIIDIKDRGCLLQLNLLSLTEYYGNDVKKIAKKLIEEDLIDFIGTDIHHNNHLNTATQFAKDSKMYALLKSKSFLNETLV